MSVPTPEERIRAKVEEWADLSGSESGLEPMEIKNEFVQLMADAIREAISEYEKREYKCRGALSTAINELETAVQGKWDPVAYVKNVRDGIIRAHDDLAVDA